MFEIICFIVGACVGSFISLSVYRLAVKEKLDSGLKCHDLRIKNKNRSYCDHCGRQLKWGENVPIISFVLLGGRSFCCHSPIPYSYVVTEILSGVLTVIWWQRWLAGGMNIGAGILGLTMIYLAIFLGVFDAKYKILPDRAVYLLIGLALVGVVLDEPNIIPYLAAGAGGFAFLGGIYWLTKGQGIGFGDVKLAVFMGLLLGPAKLVVAMMVGFVAGAIVGLSGMIFLGWSRKKELAFGPFLLLGTVVAWEWGEKIIRIWLNGL